MIARAAGQVAQVRECGVELRIITATTPTSTYIKNMIKLLIVGLTAGGRVGRVGLVAGELRRRERGDAMQTIESIAGTRIEDAARQLVAAAPAKADFNGITLRARYATTNPRDVVSRFHALWDLRAITGTERPESKRAAAEAAAQRSRELAEKQTVVDRLIGALPDFSDAGAVLTWMEAFTQASDDIDIRFDRQRLILDFALGGWLANAYIGDAFDAEDTRNRAGYIVRSSARRHRGGRHATSDDSRVRGKVAREVRDDHRRATRHPRDDAPQPDDCARLQVKGVLMKSTSVTRNHSFNSIVGRVG